MQNSKTFTKKSSDKKMLENLQKMANKTDSIYFMNITSFGKSTPTAKVLMDLELIMNYKNDNKKYLWIGSYPTLDTVKLIKDYVKKIESEKPEQKPEQKPQKPEKLVMSIVETLKNDTNDFDKDESKENSNPIVECEKNDSKENSNKPIDKDESNKPDVINMTPVHKCKIVEKKTTSTINKTVILSHWLFSNCNLDPDQVIDIIDNISSTNNTSETILKLVVKYKIPTDNIDDFQKECKKFN